jgi:hypothetical protein
MKKKTKGKTKPTTKQEPLLNRLASQVGRAAGKIVAAGQGLGITEAFAEKPNAGSARSQRKPKQRATTKKKKRVTKKSSRVAKK